jgi:putative acetyltransferase
VKRELIETRREPLTSAVAAKLIAALNAELSSRYREVGANHFRLDEHEVEEGRGAFLVAYWQAMPIGCGAVRRLDDHTAEIKRMYVDPKARGKGAGRVILVALELEARALGAKSILLETGERQFEAVNLYESAGFRRIEAFGEYLGSPLSICMKKDL